MYQFSLVFPKSFKKHFANILSDLVLWTMTVHCRPAPAAPMTCWSWAAHFPSPCEIKEWTTTDPLATCSL